MTTPSGQRLSEPCPGYKRPCGVWTPRRLCHYCEKSKQLDKKENR